MKTSNKFNRRALASYLFLLPTISQRQLLLGLLLLSQFVLACAKQADDVIDPALQSPPPMGIGGKWMYGTFSPSSFWGTDGSYNGSGYEQAMAFHFTADGTYEMYVMNVTTYYSCRTGVYTYWKGKAKFNESDQSITLTPLQGTQRGEYSCASGKNFKRTATESELANAHKTYYYATETDLKGQPALRLYFGTSDNQGAQLTKGTW